MRGVSDAQTPAQPADRPEEPRPEPVTPVDPVPATPPGSLGGPPAPPGPSSSGGPAVPRPAAGTGGLSPTPPVPPPPRTAWGARLAVVGIGAVAGVLGWLAATRFLPEWWAHQIGDVADGSLTAGVAAGLACGVAFTLMPLLVLRGTFRRGITWSARFVYFVLAALLAVPNLITLGIVLGSGSSAVDARRILDVEGQGFRGATLFGVVVGALLAVGLWAMLWRGKRRTREIAALRSKLAETRTPEVEGRDGGREGGRDAGRDAGRGDERGDEPERRDGRR